MVIKMNNTQPIRQ